LARRWHISDCILLIDSARSERLKRVHHFTGVASRAIKRWGRIQVLRVQRQQLLQLFTAELFLTFLGESFFVLSNFGLQALL